MCVCQVAVSGLGFGILSGAFSIVNVLADMAGPGTIGIFGDSQYFFLASGELLFSCLLPCGLFRKRRGVGGSYRACCVVRLLRRKKVLGFCWHSSAMVA